MPEIVLHHYPLSPFSEKIRLLFGLKNLDWRSVEVPVVPPRPHLTPVLGAFRRIPVLQIGADYYCDTLAISNVIERLNPSPGQTQPEWVHPVCWWSENGLFMNALCLTIGAMAGNVPDVMVEDRRQFFGFDVDPHRLLAQRATYVQRVHAHLSWLAAILADGRPFIFDNHAGIADLACYHPIWFARQFGGAEIEALLPAVATSPWYDRVTALGHGNAYPMDAEEATAIALAATPESSDLPSPEADIPGLRLDARVRIVANDYGKDPVVGNLLSLSADAVVIRHHDKAVGDVNLHFSRVGFDVHAV